MSIEVTMNIFSGRPNPKWLLDGDQERQLTSRILELERRPGMRVFRVGGLGYRGFHLKVRPRAGAKLRGTLRVYGGTVDFFERTGGVDADRRLERLLLDTYPISLDPQTLEYARSQFKKIYHDPQCRPSATSGRRNLRDRPAYRPAPWNTDESRSHNNCYSYANDRRFDDGGEHASPGESVGEAISFGTCRDFLEAAKLDGLRPRAEIAGEGPPLALFVDPQGDYHWYRQDRSGSWSHKPGGWQVRNCDESGKRITDPRKADVLNYRFCAFFTSSREVRDRIS